MAFGRYVQEFDADDAGPRLRVRYAGFEASITYHLLRLYGAWRGGPGEYIFIDDWPEVQALADREEQSDMIITHSILSPEIPFRVPATAPAAVNEVAFTARLYFMGFRSSATEWTLRVMLLGTQFSRLAMIRALRLRKPGPVGELWGLDAMHSEFDRAESDRGPEFENMYRGPRSGSSSESQ
jgi:hypothetical protein